MSPHSEPPKEGLSAFYRRVNGNLVPHFTDESMVACIAKFCALALMLEGGRARVGAHVLLQSWLCGEAWGWERRVTVLVCKSNHLLRSSGQYTQHYHLRDRILFWT